MNASPAYSFNPLCTPRAAEEKPLSILVEYEDLLYVMEDSCISLRSMLISSFVSDSQSATQDLLDSLLLLQEIMAAWLPCQHKWLYLQRIFKEEKYQKKLPDDFRLYQAISDTYTTFIHQVTVGKWN